MSSKKIHITKEQEHIPISEMSGRHLVNTINFIKRRAKEGVMVGGGGHDMLEMWVDIACGERAESFLNLSWYEEELKRRKL